MKINNNDISVVIPMFNSEEYIVSVLDSILGQTAKSFLREIVIVNDGSTDCSKEIVQGYGNKTDIPIVLVDIENSGVSNARNIGMQRALGNWIAFCDSDDIWLKNKIEKQVDIINSSSVPIDLLGGNHLDRTLKILFKPIKQLHKGSVQELCIKVFPQTSTIIMRKSVFQSIGGFDINQRYSEDANYLMKVAAKFEYYYHPDKVIVYAGAKTAESTPGLSSNRKAMQDGVMKNLREMLNLKYITRGFYYKMYWFNQLKYLCRIIKGYSRR